MAALLPDLLALVFVAAIGVAMIWDVARFEIPDWVSLLLAVAALVGLAAGGGGLERIAVHLAVAAGLFAFGFLLFALGQWGGGDVKLLGALGLWLGWPLALPYLMVMAMAGGVLALVMLGLRRLPLPDGWRRRPWLVRLHDSASGLPYGVAIGGAALLARKAALAAILG
jgi:prepilin peptidase CpaA